MFPKGQNVVDPLPPHEPAALNVITAAMEWAYRHAIGDGLPGMEGAEALAADYRSKAASADEAINALIARQTLNAGASGFLTGLGGIVTLPAAIPANLASVLYLQLRMIAAIAHLRGHDIRSPRVRAMVIACLVGSPAADLLKDVGVNAGTKLAQQAIQRVSTAALIRLNKAVGLRLLTRIGTSGLAAMPKIVPVLGGLVAGAFDATTTRAIGAVAKKLFVPLAAPDEGPVIEGEKRIEGTDGLRLPALTDGE